MPKKRLIFVLLWADGHFVLSRNFRLQRIGDRDWLKKNYNFQSVSRYIDELVILNVSRSRASSWSSFVEAVSDLARDNFVPIAAGGFGLRTDRAAQLLKVGADKVVVNRALFGARTLVEDIVECFGRQSVVGSVDLTSSLEHGLQLYFPESHNRPREYCPHPKESALPVDLVGELMVRSVDRDGTGRGLDLDLLSKLPAEWSLVPLIAAGGAGKPEHLIQALKDYSVSAVATANLLNFIGDGLEKTRAACLEAGIELAQWL